MPDDKKKKRPAVSSENTAKHTDYKKKATKAYAAKGTTLAKEGTEMRKMQDAQAKKRAESQDKKKYSSKTRESNIDKSAQEMERAAFKNADQKRFKSKGYFGK